MSARCRFLYGNAADNATITSSTTVAKFPASNVQVAKRCARCRLSGVTGVTLTFDLATAQDFSAIGLIDHNMTGSGTVTLAGSSDGASWTDIDVGTTDKDPFVMFTGVSSYRYYRLTFDDAGNASGYIEVGRVFLGTWVELSRNFDYGWSRGTVDPSQGAESSNGAEMFWVRPKYDVAHMVFNFLTADDCVLLRAMFAAVGNTEPFLVYMFPDDSSDTALYARITGPLNLPNGTVNYFSVTIDLKEYIG